MQIGQLTIGLFGSVHSQPYPGHNSGGLVDYARRAESR